MFVHLPPWQKYKHYFTFIIIYLHSCTFSLAREELKRDENEVASSEGVTANAQQTYEVFLLQGFTGSHFVLHLLSSPATQALWYSLIKMKMQSELVLFCKKIILYTSTRSFIS